MWHWLLNTPDDISLFLIRVLLGGVILPHGAQKLIGWFGGHGIQGTLQYFSKNLGIPTPLGLLAILAESVGALLLVFGVGGRLMAAAIAAVMVVAASSVHLRNGFFMNWTGAQRGEGFEFHLLALALAAAIIIRGSGALSIDRVLVH